MRALPATMAERLATGATTHCRCWELKRADGVVMGFTDHDRDLAFEGVTFEAESGLNATAVEIASGLSVDTHSVTGALTSEAIRERDLEAGLYDSAEVTLWLVDWTDVASRLLLSRGFVGEVRRQGARFEAEVVGLAERLNQPYGLAYLARCNARLGDGRCGVDLAAPEWRGTALVSAVREAQSFEVTGLGGFADGFFARGQARWLDGANAGTGGHVKRHRVAGGVVSVELWLSPSSAVAVGDTLELVAGCDKRPETCAGRFSNFMNFRGFPHMPGDDWAAGYPEDGGSHDGGSLRRG